VDLPTKQSWFEHLTRFHAFFILLLLGLLAYANAVNHPFVHDDVVFLVQNPDLGNLNPKNYFALTSSPGIDHPNVNQYYRPLLELTNRILYRIIRLDPHGFHIFNILLHVINGFLVYNCIRFITNGKKGFSLGIAVLFLVHPVQSEAVACISGISNLVFTFLCLSSFILYLVSSRVKQGKVQYLFSLILFSLALLSKEQSVILPVIILAYEFCFARVIFKIPRQRWMPIAGFFMCLAGYFLLRKLLLDSTLAITADNLQEHQLIWLAIPRSLLIYLSIIFFPRNLHYYRSQDILLPFAWPILALAMIIIIVVFLIFRMPQPQKRWMIFGLAWFGISLLPTLNIIPIVNEYSTILTAEHFVYLPIIGILLYIFAIAHFWVEQKKYKNSRSICFIILGIVTMVFVLLTAKQNVYWRGEIPLFERTLQFEKGFGRVHILLAKSYSDAGRFEDAVAEDQKALMIMQNYLGKIQNKKIKKFYELYLEKIHYHLGYCFDKLGDLAGSLDHYRKALAYSPENHFIQYAVGIAYIKINDFHNAIVTFEKILKSNEDNLVVMNSLALCYQAIGKQEKAGKLLRIIAEQDSQSVSAKENLEKFLRKQQGM